MHQADANQERDGNADCGPSASHCSFGPPTAHLVVGYNSFGWLCKLVARANCLPARLLLQRSPHAAPVRLRVRPTVSPPPKRSTGSVIECDIRPEGAHIAALTHAHTGRPTLSGAQFVAHSSLRARLKPTAATAGRRAGRSRAVEKQQAVTNSQPFDILYQIQLIEIGFNLQLSTICTKQATRSRANSNSAKITSVICIHFYYLIKTPLADAQSAANVCLDWRQTQVSLY